ncbi:hypothetical protein PROSTU_02404 [Providencia stuartii ATCC 25827]|uniref:Uncharacterized protein n=1 Tax=Providencia stuartii ATCC 25827 TaxID=471874 RepID=A0AA86YS40_PROST|nr:hypothetical protein PROSTU_02404 [Providencia stuartii ATCC 25827]
MVTQAVSNKQESGNKRQKRFAVEGAKQDQVVNSCIATLKNH